jgi:hypothetical protein
VSTFDSLPANASVEKVLLRIKHGETYAAPGVAPTLTATVTYADGSTTTVPVGAVNCASGSFCTSSTGAVREDTLDVTQAYLASTATNVPAVRVTFQVTAKATPTTVEALDGIALDVTYAPSGGFRRQSGCAVLPISSDNHCDTVTNSAGGSLFVQGTVDTPLGRVNITTATGDPVQFNRGVIARDIVGAIHPGNGQANPFGLGRPTRLAVLTAEVLRDGVWRPTITSMVRLDDSIAAGTTRGRVTYISWRVIR